MKRLLFLSFFLISAVAFAKPPNIGKVPELKFDPPQPTRITLSNGVIVYMLEDHELPLFHMRMKMKMSPHDELQVGAVGFMGQLWRMGGTTHRSPSKLNEELEFIAASVETGADGDSASISLSCLSKDIDQALEIYADVLFNPTFQEKQLKLIKSSHLESLRRKNETPRAIAGRAYRDILYGTQHVYGRNLTKDRVKKVKRGTLKKLHKKLAVPDHAIISVSGDFNQKELVEKLEVLFKDWKPVGRKLKEYDYDQVAPMEGNIFYVEKDFNQSRVIFGQLGIKRHHPDTFPMSLANYILGGSGTSRLFAQIRSRLGLAYVVGSFYTTPTGPGFVGAAAQTRAEATIETVKALRKELEKMSSHKPDGDEIKLAKDSILNSYIFRFDSPSTIVSEQAALEFYGYPKDYLETYPDKIRAVTAQDILKVSQKYYTPNKLKLLVVGDKKKFKGRLEELGLVTEIPLKTID